MPRRSQAPRDEAADIQRSGGRWRLRNWRLRTRLLAALLVPILAMLGFAGLRVESNLSEAGDFAAATERVRVDDTVANLVHELQRERDLTVRYVAGGRQGRPVEVLGQRERVDTARGDFEKTLTAARPELPDEAVEDFRQWERGLEGLADARYAGQHSQQSAGQVLAAYNEFVAGLLDLGGQASVDTADRELARTYLAAGAVARVKDALSIRRALVAQALASGAAPPELMRGLAGADVQVADARNNYAKFATPAQQRLLDDELNPRVEATSGVVTAVLNGDPAADPAGWDRQATQAVDAAKRAEDALRDDVRDRSTTLASEARSDALIDGAVILGVLLLAGLLAVAITRSLLRPLRTLRNSALDVAHYRLPEAVKGILADPDPRPEDAHRRCVEPVRVYSREELGQVARAFDAVHGQAVRLAGEQAMLRENVNSMFVNLSRRSQDLVERQLTVLDRMEEHEQDPDVLGGLFELDHLATRMRRNSENLLVLAGQDVGRPLPGAVAAEEIIGAALSEVEHYQRISVAATPQIGVRGEIVGDLVHVISELFENATDYSPDESPVSVVSAVTQDGEWRIDITDRGAGMPEAEIQRANTRLAEVPDVDVEVSRRMGLYVVARLARQHDIRVWLSAADLMGLTATVLVPSALVRRADASPQESPVALEEPAEQHQAQQQGRSSSVVFRPEPPRRPATALPSEPEPSEPLAPADEPADGPASAPVAPRGSGQPPPRESVAELFADPYADADTFGKPVDVPDPGPLPEPAVTAEPAATAEPAVTGDSGGTAEPAALQEQDASGAEEPAPVLPRRRPAVSEILGDDHAGATGDRNRPDDVVAPAGPGVADRAGEAGTAPVEVAAGEYAQAHGNLPGADRVDGAAGAVQPAAPWRPVRRPGAAPTADDSLTEEIPRVAGGSETGRAAAFGTREADWDEGSGAASTAARLPAPESAAEVTDGLTAPVPTVGAVPVEAEPDGRPADAVDGAAAEHAPAPGAHTPAERPAGDGSAAGLAARPHREPELEPAEQTDVSALGPGPTWPMRDGDEPAAAPTPHSLPQPEAPAGPDTSADDGSGDEPTDRMAVYRRLMTRWFEPDGDPHDWLLDSTGEDGSARSVIAGQAGATSHDSGPHGRSRNGAGADGPGTHGSGTNGAGRGVPGHAGAAPGGSHSGLDHDGLDHSGADHSGADHGGLDHSGAVPAGSAAARPTGDGGDRNGRDADGVQRRAPAFIDRSPEAIRERMSGLQRATARARHARTHR
ncbi:signal transduction histidine kinase [Prauserella isguenensis]|uniref:histidine kinase n=1 Tax=Prauserella isguenensis TaxID=1470180 RepID=A0A839RXX5_9PSEU|nr:nitrate- and nitrite sensing domain-containing protein [Prauserella isguenensis]MBB3050306.1 signal transduction histidine kinase [Prauserella isguenensis]